MFQVRDRDGHDSRGCDVAGILVVDDESEARRNTRRFLERQGWEVEDAGGERDAQRLIEDRGEPFDLLVADVVLAGDENGVVLAEDFYRRGWARKVLFVSAYVDVDLGLVGVPYPDKDFVGKLKGLARMSEAARELLTDPLQSLCQTRSWTDRDGTEWFLTFRPELVFEGPVIEGKNAPRIVGGRIRFESDGRPGFEHTPEFLKPLGEYPRTELQDIVDLRSRSAGSPS